ncbi:serine/threonine-protein kinase [Nonomuraea sp. NPDC050394]|uniref:serine/threonine-protein kinase n=1 Tax=Nonomuraea sp. NPDC050394 TaxID=3364363 RepID=UPI0037B70D05
MQVRPLRSSDPREVHGYALRGRLGEGGQGTVFLGAAADGSLAAVKVLHARSTEDGEARRYLQRELNALRRVASFCTARVLAADPDADPPYVISEYIDGPSLQEVIRARGVLAGAELDRLAVATATALGAIHAAGVVHRDFKPANVLLAADGPRVIDFGIARPMDATAATVSSAVGTPAYMAPEQLSGHPAGPPMDMFAWACTMAYAANGRPPFGDETLPVVINRILNAQPDLGRMDGRLRGFVAACLEKDPARRPSARQVLLGLMEQAPRGTLPPPPPHAQPIAGGPPPPRPVHGSSLPPGPVHGPPSLPPRLPGQTRPGSRTARVTVGAAVAAVLVLGSATAVYVATRPDATGTRVTTTPTLIKSPSPRTSQDTGTPVGDVTRSPRLGLEVWQDDKPVALSLDDLDSPVTVAQLRAAPFELRFPKLAEGRALQVCAWTDKSVFSIEDGAKVDSHPCFRPGTGVADYEYGSGTLYLNNNDGHNYLAGNRVAAQSATQDKVFVSKVFRDGADTPLAGFGGTLYLAAFIDLNGDKAFKRAGEGEYDYLTLKITR